MKLLLVTGAGASRHLALEGEMPLMPEWANSLSMDLEAEESGLPIACNLLAGMSGPDFEWNLGQLLRWMDGLSLQRRYLTLGGDKVGSYTDKYMMKPLENAERRATTIMTTVNTSLYKLFGQRQISARKARDAYERLLGILPDPTADLIVATTNYDRSAEEALAELGRDVATGFVRRGQRTPRLDPVGLIQRRGENSAVVLHLHGAVGWYEAQGTVEDHYADQDFNPSLGAPVVLYPDPEKDPTGHSAVGQIWTEFREALGLATHLLILGHSLNDPSLLAALAHANSDVMIGATYVDDEGRAHIATKLGNRAIAIRFEFGPEPAYDQAEFARWATA